MIMLCIMLLYNNKSTMFSNSILEVETSVTGTIIMSYCTCCCGQAFHHCETRTLVFCVYRVHVKSRSGLADHECTHHVPKTRLNICTYKPQLTKRIIACINLDQKLQLDAICAMELHPARSSARTSKFAMAWISWKRYDIPDVFHASGKLD